MRPLPRPHTILRPNDIESLFKLNQRPLFYRCLESLRVSPSVLGHFNPGKLWVGRSKYNVTDFTELRQDHIYGLHYRLDLIMQRVCYMQSMGYNQQERRAVIDKSPPALILVCENANPEKLWYLKGIVKNDKEHLHVLYPLHDRLVVTMDDILEKFAVYAKFCNMDRDQALRRVYRMPLLMAFGSKQVFGENGFIKLHLMDLPYRFSIDRDTASMYPPIIQPKFRVTLADVPDALGPLRTVEREVDLNQVLDYTYNAGNGVGLLEDLNYFLRVAAKAEEWDTFYRGKIPGRKKPVEKELRLKMESDKLVRTPDILKR